MDKKALIVGGLIMSFLGATAAGLYYMVIGRSSNQDFKAVETARNIDFPSTPPGSTFEEETPTAAGREPLERIPPPNDWDAAPGPRGSPGGSSLGFVRGKVQGAGSAAGGEMSSDAAEAAKAGDIQGMLRSARQNQSAVPDAAPGKLGSKAIRGVMQQVVDGIHNIQPAWYDEYLANKYLKRIADNYDKSGDFGRFLKELGQSKSFYAMLKKKYATTEMRDLTRQMFRDKTLKRNLTQIFLEEPAVSHVYPLIAKFGLKAGLPEVMVKTAKSKATTSNRIYEKRKKARAQPARKQLKTINLGGGSPGELPPLGQHESATEGHGPPAGEVDKSKIPAEYQKYLPK